MNPRPAVPSAKSRAVVAGGAGFIGSHLSEWLLVQGYEVIVVDSFLAGTRDTLAPLLVHPRLRVIDHDVTEPLPADLTADIVFNLACAASSGRYQADPLHKLTTSVVGTRNLLDLAARARAVYVQASTSEVYGDPEKHPQREDYWGHVNPTGSRACYDEGRRAAETLCFDLWRAGQVDARVARIFNTYGPRMQPDDGRIVSNVVCQALLGRPITVYGTGEQTRCFCYVFDMVLGLCALAAAGNNPGQPINLGNPGEFTINALVRLVLAMTGSRSEILHLERPPDDPKRRRPDIGFTSRFLGWRPSVTIEEGLRPTIAWFSARLSLPQPALATLPKARGKPAPADRARLRIAPPA